MVLTQKRNPRTGDWDLVNEGGGGGSGTEYTISTAALQRDIVHSLGRRPAVTCYDASNNIIRPNIIHHLSNTQLQIVWLTAQAGTALIT